MSNFAAELLQSQIAARQGFMADALERVANYRAQADRAQQDADQVRAEIESLQSALDQLSAASHV